MKEMYAWKITVYCGETLPKYVTVAARTNEAACILAKAQVQTMLGADDINALMVTSLERGFCIDVVENVEPS